MIVVWFFLPLCSVAGFFGVSSLSPFFHSGVSKVIFWACNCANPTSQLVVVSLLPSSRHYWLDADSRLFLPRTCKAIKSLLEKKCRICFVAVRAFVRSPLLARGACFRGIV